MQEFCCRALRRHEEGRQQISSRQSASSAELLAIFDYMQHAISHSDLALVEIIAFDLVELSEFCARIDDLPFRVEFNPPVGKYIQ